MSHKLNLNHFFYLLICIISFSCGNLKSFKTSRFPIIAYDKDSFSIKLDSCNQEKCIQSKNILHIRLKKVVENFLRQSGFLIVDDPLKAKFKIHLISAFENSIDELQPRNIYMILKGKNNDEITQFGISENYSTTLNKENISLLKLEKLFKLNLIETISNTKSLHHLVEQSASNN